MMTLVLCFVTVPDSATRAATTLTDNKTGTEDGYDYELWKDTGTTSMSLTGGGTFSCEWSNINNALFRKGKKFDSTKTYKELGNISIDFACDYNPNGNSYLCVYGWTKSPLVEYYIVESWGTWRPPGATSKGQVTIDGGTYDIYETTRVNQPSIEGNTTFEQYWSVRTTKRNSGTISVSKHFAAWESMGMKMGKMYETALNVEGYQSSGKANVYKNNINIGGSSSESDTQPTTQSPTQATTSKIVDPDTSGCYFHSTFENGSDNWSSRGSAKVSDSSDSAFAGSKSLSVTGRTDAWNGAAYSLDSSVFQPGNTYSFGTMVRQNSGSAQDMVLSLQYDDASGKTQYVNVAKANAASGTWTKLENTAYTIPSGATNMLLYVETPENLIDFNIDEAFGGVKGTSISSGSSQSTTSAQQPTTGSATVYGDANCDGKVDISDVVAVRRSLIDSTTFKLKAQGEINADVHETGNGVNAQDAVTIQQKILGLIEFNVPVNTVTTKVTTNAATTVTTTTTKTALKEGQWDNQADISWIDKSKPMVAICFDDGPVGTASSSTSTRIQNALSQNGAHATFFYWGNRITSANQAEIARADQLGFEVANHTYTHPYLTNLSADGIKQEVNKTADILSGIIGKKQNYLIRPPYLAVNDTVKQNCGAPLITCGVDSQDWNNASKDQIINTITSKMANGTLKNQVVLMHETYSTTAEAMEYLAPYMKKQGWQIVTVSEMFKANGKDMYNGQVYTSAN